MKATTIDVKGKLETGQVFKISRFKEIIKKTKPHKHEGYFELIYMEFGAGFHWIETERHTIDTPELYLLQPGQLHCWQFTSIPKGFVVLFKEDFFDPVKQSHLVDLIKNINRVTRVALPDSFNPGYILEQMFIEYCAPSPYSTSIIHGYLQVLFSQILHLSQIEEKGGGQHAGPHERFLKLLPHKCPELRLVKEYADLLNTTPQNLNMACRKHTTKSAGEHIAAQLLLEAKRYILHTDKTINQVAEILHFNDTSYFVKFFKKHEGTTPQKFREGHFQ